MLVLSRRTGESVVLPSMGLTMTVISVTAGTVRLGFQAPPTVHILRSELSVLTVEQRARPFPAPVKESTDGAR